jgi:hypothetical protein
MYVFNHPSTLEGREGDLLGGWGSVMKTSEAAVTSCNGRATRVAGSRGSVLGNGAFVSGYEGFRPVARDASWSTHVLTRFYHRLIMMERVAELRKATTP